METSDVCCYANKNEECWGTIIEVDEQPHGWGGKRYIYACEGHLPIESGGSYIARTAATNGETQH